MPKFHVTVDGAVPTGFVLEAADAMAAFAQIREELLDWADTAPLSAEEIEPAGKRDLSPEGEEKAKSWNS